jgi:uncharacterized OsmC-like protein
MTLVTPELKEGIRKLFDRLSGPDDPATKMGPTVATAVMTGPQASEASWPNYKVKSNESTSVGGKDAAPTPSSIFVASIGFAENVIFARQAVLQGVDFDSLETKVEAQWDRKGIFGIRNADPSITSMFIETKIGTGAPPAKVVELLRLTDKRSPLTTTVAKSAAVRRKLFVNGAEIPL